MSNQYLGCTIFGFSSGSIIVDYIAHIDDVEPTNSTVVESAFTESYMQSANDGRLNVTADVAASGVTGNEAMCKIDGFQWQCCNSRAKQPKALFIVPVIVSQYVDVTN